MKAIDSTGALLVHVPGWVDGWVEVKAVLRIAYSNQKKLIWQLYGEKMSCVLMESQKSSLGSWIVGAFFTKLTCAFY
jgi:hypothetical protein